MTRFWVFFCTGLVCCSAVAQTGLPEGFQDQLKRTFGTGARTSASRQFTIFDAPSSPARPLEFNQSVHTNLVRLDPTLLAVTCERIKSALLQELISRDDWRGKVAINLRRAANMDERVVIGSLQTGGGWTYYMELPDTVDRTRLVSAAVSVLLLEMANRYSERVAEIPAWLVQGLTRELMLSSPAPLVLDQPQRFGAIMGYLELSGIRRDPLRLAHEEMNARPPMTLEELSWPDGGDEAAAFRASAQLLVHELLQLRDGRACLRTMIQNLAHHYNWQTAFMAAFRSHFPTDLDAEKWWALKVANFTGRDLMRAWPLEESWKKLDETLRTAVHVRLEKNEMPLRTEVNCQTIIRDWDFQQQSGVLNYKLQQLFMVRNWVSQDLKRLADDYRQAIDGYLKKREKSTATGNGQTRGDRDVAKIIQDTIQQLDMLDEIRQDLRPKETTSSQVAADNPTNR